MFCAIGKTIKWVMCSYHCTVLYAVLPYMAQIHIS